MLLQRDAFLHITWGMLGFTGAKDWPERFYEGQAVETRLLFFGVIPAWKHKLRVVRIDHEKMELQSEEQGGWIRRWDHRKWIKRDSESSCWYTDEVVVEAGILTFFVWVFAQVFYRYRQWRMRQLTMHV